MNSAYRNRLAVLPALVGLIVSLALTPSAQAHTPDASTAAPAHRVRGQQDPGGAAPNPFWMFNELHCPSTTVCYAGGFVPSSDPRFYDEAAVEKTTDGGVTWTLQTLDLYGTETNQDQQLACPDVDTCYLLSLDTLVPAGAVVMKTTDGGQSWKTAYSETGTQLEHIACPSAAACDVSLLGGGLLATSDGGKTWSRGAASPADTTRGMACPDVDDCYLAMLTQPHGLAVTHDRGQTWSVPALPPGTYSSVDCPGVDHCYAQVFPPPGETGAMDVLVTQDGWKTWTRLPISNEDSFGTPGQIVCPSGSVCYTLADAVSWRTADAGASWQPLSGAAIRDMGVSCPTTTICYGIQYDDPIVFKTTDGEIWQQIGEFAPPGDTSPDPTATAPAPAATPTAPAPTAAPTATGKSTTQSGGGNSTTTASSGRGAKSQTAGRIASGRHTVSQSGVSALPRTGGGSG